MTEKVKLTREQAEAIKELKKRKFDDDVIVHNTVFYQVTERERDTLYTALKDIHLDSLIRALYIGYEIEEEYKVGDWVVITEEHNSKGKVLQIKIVESAILNLDYGNGFQSWWPVSSLRHATPEEIKTEQERRVWAKIGREVGEFRDGDLSIGKDGFEYKTIQGMNAAYKESDLKGFYPAESFIEFGGGEE